MPTRITPGPVPIGGVTPTTTRTTDPVVTPTTTPTPAADGFDARPTRNLPDPKLYPVSGNKTAPTYQRQTGILFVDGANSSDVKQGQLGDCYFLSAIAAWADANPGELEKRIRDNGDGTYDVLFLEGAAEEQEDGTAVWAVSRTVVTVDADLPSDESGAIAYGKSTNSKELWVSLFEKAFAERSKREGLLGLGKKDGYQGIGNGGGSNDVFRLLDGKQPTEPLPIRGVPAAGLLAMLKQNVEKRVPMTASTPKDLAWGQMLIPEHAYSVLGVSEHDGKAWVTLRNPWATIEPGNDGVDDGRFEMDFDTFREKFGTLYF